MTLLFSCSRCTALLDFRGEPASTTNTPQIGICSGCLAVFVFEWRGPGIHVLTASEAEAMPSELRASLSEARRVLAFEQIRARLGGPWERN